MQEIPQAEGHDLQSMWKQPKAVGPESPGEER